jgi:hypothetical protein
VQLGAKLDWDWIDREIAPLYSDKGRPGIFVIGLLLTRMLPEPASMQTALRESRRHPVRAASFAVHTTNLVEEVYEATS